MKKILLKKIGVLCVLSLLANENNPIERKKNDFTFYLHRIQILNCNYWPSIQCSIILRIPFFNPVCFLSRLYA